MESEQDCEEGCCSLWLFPLTPTLIHHWIFLLLLGIDHLQSLPLYRWRFPLQIPLRLTDPPTIQIYIFIYLFIYKEQVVEDEKWFYAGGDGCCSSPGVEEICFSFYLFIFFLLLLFFYYYYNNNNE
jgi:hypothetical protein